MTRRPLILCLAALALPMLCAGTAQAQRPDLNESQRVRLETANDRSQTVDEAAFYALLENAADWPDGAGAAGAIVPDYAALSDTPADWRGRLCLIEGQLEMALPPQDLSRSGWDRIRGLVIRTEPEGKGSDGSPQKGRPIVLYVTEPPELEPTWINENVLKQRGWRVRAVGRFYKLVDWASRGGERSTYPVFVGKGLSRFEPSEGGSGGSGGGGGGGFSPSMVAAFGLVMVMAAAFLIYRVIAMRRSFRGGSRLDEYRRQRQAARVRPEAETVNDATDSTDLPEDPAAAMEELARRHGESDGPDIEGPAIEGSNDEAPTPGPGSRPAPDARPEPGPGNETERS